MTNCTQCSGTGNDLSIILNWCRRCRGTGKEPSKLTLTARWLGRRYYRFLGLFY